MRNIITIISIIFVAASLIVGCKSATMKTTTAASTSAVASTNAVAATTAAAATTVPSGPNTPAQTTAENLKLGELAGIFIALMALLAVKRC